MNKKVYGLPEKEWIEILDNLDRKNFEIKATESSIWFRDAQNVYRASEILAAYSIEARNKSGIRAINEFKKNKDKGNFTRQGTIDEYIEMIDSNQIRIAFFLLARALELLLKAILIEMKPDSFYDIKKRYKLTIPDNRRHEIDEMMRDTGIILTSDDENNLKLLSHYPFIGTYPIPKSVNRVIEKRKLGDDLQKNLNHHNYEDVSKLYDLALAKYNELLISKGKTERVNYFKIKKHYGF